jgi:hypothetical protein
MRLDCLAAMCFGKDGCIFAANSIVAVRIQHLRYR